MEKRYASYVANEPGHWDFRTDNVYFYMTNGEYRVSLRSNRPGAGGLEPNFGRTEKGRLDAFDTHRAIIERAASAKSILKDGRTIE